MFEFDCEQLSLSICIEGEYGVLCILVDDEKTIDDFGSPQYIPVNNAGFEVVDFDGDSDQLGNRIYHNDDGEIVAFIQNENREILLKGAW